MYYKFCEFTLQESQGANIEKLVKWGKYYPTLPFNKNMLWMHDRCVAHVPTYLMLVRPETGYWAYSTAGPQWQASCAAEERGRKEEEREEGRKLHTLSTV